jgi:hypothetical protein
MNYATMATDGACHPMLRFWKGANKYHHGRTPGSVAVSYRSDVSTRKFWSHRLQPQHQNLQLVLNTLSAHPNHHVNHQQIGKYEIETMHETTLSPAASRPHPETSGQLVDGS